MIAHYLGVKMEEKKYSSKNVNHSIKKYIIPILKENGFSVFTNRNAWRYKPNTVDVIQFMSYNSFRATILNCTTFSFAINLGVYVKSIPSDIKNNMRLNMLCPDIPFCHLFGYLLKTIEQNECKTNRIWYIDEKGHNIESVMCDVASVIRSDALSWFNRLENLNEIIKLLENDDKDILVDPVNGRINCPSRNYKIGYIALALNDNKLASRSLKKAIDSECYKSEQILNDYQLALLKSNAEESDISATQ